MRASFNFALSMTTLISVVSCGGSAPSEPAVDATEDGISATTAAFVTLTRDTRRCVSPLCGGYYLTDVNTTREPRYVSGLDFSQSNLDQATVLETPFEELVLFGVLGPRETRFNTRPLIVQEAYRGLPGMVRRATDRFYTVAVNNPPIVCITAPCNNASGQQVNRRIAPVSLTGVDVTEALAPMVDGAWVNARIERDGALVAGRVVNGASFPGGRARILNASQVFIRLPFEAAACPLVRFPPCAEPLVRTYQRNDDRCVLPSECVEGGACILSVPSCAEGYTLSSYTAGMFACASYVCDPTFTLPAAEEPPVGRCPRVRCASGTHCVEEGPIACVSNDEWTSEAIDVRSASPYRNNQRQAWLITSEVANTSQVRLNFTSFSLENNYDFVTVIDDATGAELARYTGNIGAFVSEGFLTSSIRVVFTSDGSVTGPGFVIDRLDAL